MGSLDPCFAKSHDKYTITGYNRKAPKRRELKELRELIGTEAFISEFL
jgi:hypothetical protein